MAASGTAEVEELAHAAAEAVEAASVAEEQAELEGGAVVLDWHWREVEEEAGCGWVQAADVLGR